MLEGANGGRKGGMKETAQQPEAAVPGEDNIQPPNTIQYFESESQAVCEILIEY